jgi:hypothetical protein
MGVPLEQAPGTFQFTLSLLVPELTDEILDRLFEAGCDDALPGTCQGVVFLDFTRDAASRDEAIQSALVDLKDAGFDAELATDGADESRQA